MIDYLTVCVWLKMFELNKILEEKYEQIYIFSLPFYLKFHKHIEAIKDEQSFSSSDYDTESANKCQHLEAVSRSVD